MPVVSFVPTYEIVLTRRCAYGCGYCDFASRPSPQPPSQRAFLRQLRLAARMGVNQVHLVAGEGIAELPEIHRVCRYYGYATWYDYLRALVETVVTAEGMRPLVPVLDVGELAFADLHRMRRFLPALRLMLDSADDRLQYRVAHRLAPHKTLASRLRALEVAGKAGQPVITGILVGIGESEASWAMAAENVAKLHEQYHHIQSFVLRPFEPALRTPMELALPPTRETFLRACRVVSKILRGKVLVVAEIESRLEWLDDLLQAGIRDLGAVRLGGNESIATDLAAALATLEAQLEEKGWRLRPRQTIVNGMARRCILPPAVAELLQRQRDYRATSPQEGDHQSKPLSAS